MPKTVPLTLFCQWGGANSGRLTPPSEFGASFLAHLMNRLAAFSRELDKTQLAPNRGWSLYSNTPQIWSKIITPLWCGQQQTADNFTDGNCSKHLSTPGAQSLTKLLDTDSITQWSESRPPILPYERRNAIYLDVFAVDRVMEYLSLKYPLDVIGVWAHSGMMVSSRAVKDSAIIVINCNGPTEYVAGRAQILLLQTNSKYIGRSFTTIKNCYGLRWIEIIDLQIRWSSWHEGSLSPKAEIKPAKLLCIDNFISGQLFEHLIHQCWRVLLKHLQAVWWGMSLWGAQSLHTPVPSVISGWLDITFGLGPWVPG